MANDKRVVITGIGPIASPGIGKDELWNGVMEQRVNVGLKEIRLDDEMWDKFYIHEIANFDIERFNILSDSLNDIRTWKKGKEDKDLLYVLAAVKLALDDSKVYYDKEDNNVGLFLTIEHPGFESFCEGIIRETLSYIESNPPNYKTSRSKLFKHIYERFAPQGYDLQTFMYLYFVAKVFGIHGYSLFTNNACASGLYALESASRQIRYGGSPVVILAGGDVSDTMFKHLWFKDQGLYAEDGKMKPFSKYADGVVMGEGASALVLEELEHALRRNAHIYAEYTGGGFSFESWKVSIPKVGDMFYQRAINDALQAANTDPQSIDLINPHGVAIKVTDAYEAKAIEDIFCAGSEKPRITSFKPYIGHNLGGSAIIECILLLLSMEHEIIPPALNCDEIEPKYNIELVRDYLKHPVNIAMKLSCGFAGYNGAAIFRKWS